MEKQGAKLGTRGSSGDSEDVLAVVRKMVHLHTYINLLGDEPWDFAGTLAHVSWSASQPTIQEDDPGRPRGQLHPRPAQRPPASRDGFSLHPKAASESSQVTYSSHALE